MEKDKTGNRLLALDGLRGFAIILVFLNHITTGYITNVIPFDILGWFFGDGVTGVTFLFILSGFLMASIYPQPVSSLGFLQKRYTRIFPLFLVMCTIMFFYHLFPHNPILFFMGSILLISIVVNIIWVKLIKPRGLMVKRGLFISFIFLQIFVGLFYALWVMRHPPIIFNQLWPASIRESVIYLVNATLTLPLGDYVPMLDGVYWSLVSEVLFYVLYPILAVPFIHFIRPQTKVFKWLIFLSLILLFIGITILSHRIFVMSLIQPALWVYFLTGIVLANIYKHKEKIFHSFTDKFINIPLVIAGMIFVGVLLSEHLCEIYFPDSYGPWIRIAYTIPLTSLVAILLNQKTSLHRFFSKKAWVFLGTISYSVYLSHALIIHLAENLFTPTNIIGNIFYVGGTFIVDILVAYFLFTFLEKPYFTRTQPTKNTAQAKIVRLYHPRFLGSILITGYLVAIFFAYQSQFNFFSVIYPTPSQNIIPSSPAKVISFKDQPIIQLSFTGQADNLGLIAATFSHIKGPLTNQTLIFTLKQIGVDKPLAVGSYTLDYFNSKSLFPFGFPPIADSQGKNYLVTFSLSNKDSTDFVTVDKTSFQTIYPADKKILISNPVNLLFFIKSKLSSITANSEARIVFLAGLPFILLSLFLMRRK